MPTMTPEDRLRRKAARKAILTKHQDNGIVLSEIRVKNIVDHKAVEARRALAKIMGANRRGKKRNATEMALGGLAGKLATLKASLVTGV